MRLLSFLLFAVSFHSHAIDVVDDSGQQIHLEQPAQRIISLAPNITELLFAAGAGDKVIAAVNYSNYPEAAKQLPRVGGYKKLDMERIVQIQPDMIIAWQTGNRPVDMSQLQKLGLTVFYTEPRQLADIASLLKRLGKLAGTQQQANKAADAYMQRLHRLEKKYQGKQILRAFYQIWDKPLMTVNDEHIISDVMQLCGLQNVFADIQNLVPRVNVEAVLEQDPQIIIAGGISQVKPDWAQQWQQWRTLSASQFNALIEVNPDIIQRHSPRILLGASELCEKADTVRNARAQQNPH